MDDDKHLKLHQKNSSTEEKMLNEQIGADKGLFSRLIVPILESLFLQIDFVRKD